MIDNTGRHVTGDELGDREPTPEEITECSAEIRAGWTERTIERRSGNRKSAYQIPIVANRIRECLG